MIKYGMSDRLRLVINHILNRTTCESQTKLHLLLYYCQAYSLAETGIKMFDEEFVADVNGPRCLEVDNIVCILNRPEVKSDPTPTLDVI
jgi:uncharacterized phage-associated protein